MRLAKPGPHVQYGLWLAVLSLAILLPTHGMGRIGERTPQAIPALTRKDFVSNRPQSKDHQPLLLQASTHTVRVAAPWANWLVRLYLGTLIVALLRVAQAWRSAWSLATYARDAGTHATALAKFSRRFGVTPPPMRESASIASPMIVGVATPVLLVPENFAQFTAEEIGAAFCHELAHIKRRDYLVNLVCQLVAVPLVWHPAMHLIQQRIRMTREMACDALAAQEMNSDLEYARCLLSLAHVMLGKRGMAAHTVTTGLFTKSTLEERIMQLTEKTTIGVQARVSRAAAGAAMMFASLVVAATFHLAPMMASTAGAIAQTTDGPAIAVPAPPALKPVPPHRAHRQQRALSAQERAQIQQQIEAARQQAAAAVAMVHSEAFQKQMEDAQRQALDARKMFFESEQFKQQMQDAQRQAAKAHDLVNNPKFKKQMEDATKQALQARAMFDSPEFKAQMDEARRQAREATEEFNNPEFKLQMEDLQRKMSEMMKDFHPEFVPPANHP